jgi:hypothetical protein
MHFENRREKLTNERPGVGDISKRLFGKNTKSYPALRLTRVAQRQANSWWDVSSSKRDSDYPDSCGPALPSDLPVALILK